MSEIFVLHIKSLSLNLANSTLYWNALEALELILIIIDNAATAFSSSYFSTYVVIFWDLNQKLKTNLSALLSS